jgi:hypothetical protein
MPQRINSIEELKTAAGDGADFFILLAGGFVRSSKHISYDKDKDKFYILNEIDGTDQTLKPESLKRKHITNIGLAIEKGAFFKDDN